MLLRLTEDANAQEAPGAHFPIILSIRVAYQRMFVLEILGVMEDVLVGLAVLVSFFWQDLVRFQIRVTIRVNQESRHVELGSALSSEDSDSEAWELIKRSRDKIIPFRSCLRNCDINVTHTRTGTVARSNTVPFKSIRQAVWPVILLPKFWIRNRHLAEFVATFFFFGWRNFIKY